MDKIERATIEAAIELLASEGVTTDEYPGVDGTVNVTAMIVSDTHDEGSFATGTLVLGLLHAVRTALTLYAQKAGITLDEARTELLDILRRMLQEEDT